MSNNRNASLLSGSNGGYTAVGNSGLSLGTAGLTNSSSQVPAARPSSYWPHASSPTAHTTASSPTFVIITNDGGGDVGFCFEPGGCDGDQSDNPKPYTVFHHNNASGDPDTNDVVTNVKLDISPIAWSGSLGASVTFYYRGEI